jgi:hypothetical protein
MSQYENIKIAVGERISLLVDTQERVEGNYGPQYRINGTRMSDNVGVSFYAPQPQWDRQMEQLGVETAAGLAVDVYRKPMEGSTTKAYWNVYRNTGKISNTGTGTATPAVAAPKAAPVAMASAASTADRKVIESTYRECMAFAVEVATAVSELDGVPAHTFADLTAMAATLFIQRANARAWSTTGQPPKVEPKMAPPTKRDDDDLPF